MKENYEQYLITAAGRIKCKRCQARSSRKKQQCGKPALRGKNVCGTHGGFSTGPKTEKGIQRIRNTHWKHGNETKEAKNKRSQRNLMFTMLEEIGWHFDMFEGCRKGGRKPKDYKKLNLNDKKQLIEALKLSLPQS